MTDENTRPIYRFKFLDDTMQTLLHFSKLHQYDDRISFKEAWKDWLFQNSEIVSIETRRHENLGYVGDIENKMFRSARYYFKNKSTNENKPIERRKYISMSSHILTLMDEHINENFNNDVDNIDSPAASYNKFCEKFQSTLLSEISRLLECGIDGEQIKNKIKKTYKNRYFRISRF